MDEGLTATVHPLTPHDAPIVAEMRRVARVGGRIPRGECDAVRDHPTFLVRGPLESGDDAFISAAFNRGDAVPYDEWLPVNDLNLVVAGQHIAAEDVAGIASTEVILGIEYWQLNRANSNWLNLTYLDFDGVGFYSAGRFGRLLGQVSAATDRAHILPFYDCPRGLLTNRRLSPPA
ncbi:MAG TPA: hypothetical protein VGL34_06820 [Steroidobacteraceae bacterium]|jgi:hypothetical protein